MDDFIGKIKDKKFRTALDVLDVIRLYFGDYKWHNNSNGSLSVTIKEGTYTIRFAYEPFVEKNERVSINDIIKEGAKNE